MTLHEQTPGIPYWRLSSFYLFYFAVLGIFLPYWSPYLRSIGFDAKAIGLLSAILAGTKIIAPNILGWIADHRGQRMRIIRIALLLACMAFSCMLFTTSFVWMALIITVFGFFWNAALPQFEATTFTHLGDSSHAYTGIRIWGSIGFIVAVVSLGKYLESHALGQLPEIILALLLAIFIVSIIVPERASGPIHVTDVSLFKVIRQTRVIALLLVAFLMQLSHAPYYIFYSIYLADHGYSSLFIGGMWAISVIAEVFIFMLMPRLITWLGLTRLLLICFTVACMRWLIIGYFVDVLPLLIIGQLMHAVTFGIFHATAIQLTHRYFTGRTQGRGQALYSSMSFGAGLSVGGLMVGFSWSSVGSLASFQGASVACVVAFLIAWRWIRD